MFGGRSAAFRLRQKRGQSAKGSVMKKLTYCQERIMRFLQGKDWTSPTDIGNGLNRYHSAWASPKCLALVKLGALERNEKGHYRIVPNNCFNLTRSKQ